MKKINFFVNYNTTDIPSYYVTLCSVVGSLKLLTISMIFWNDSTNSTFEFGVIKSL